RYGQVPRPDVLGDPLAESGFEAIEAEEPMRGVHLRDGWTVDEVVALHSAPAKPAHRLPLQQVRRHHFRMLLGRSAVLVPGLGADERGEDPGEHLATE